MSSPGIKTQYQLLVAEWEEHCHRKQFSSNPNDYVNCQAFRELVSLGGPILPLIQETLNQPGEHTWNIFGWYRLVGKIVEKEKITCPFKIPSEIAGQVDAILNYTRDWLRIWLLPMAAKKLIAALEDTIAGVKQGVFQIQNDDDAWILIKSRFPSQSGQLTR